MEKAKRDSASTEWSADGKHASLISNLDPALLQYIRRYGYEEQLVQLPDATQDVGENEENDESSNQVSVLETQTPANYMTQHLQKQFRQRTNSIPKCWKSAAIVRIQACSQKRSQSIFRHAHFTKAGHYIRPANRFSK